MIKLKRSPLILVVIFAIASGIWSCNNNSNNPNISNNSAPTQSGVLIYGSGGQPVNLEPGNITDGNSIIVQQQIYDRLLDSKPGSTDLEPALATNWTFFSNGNYWEFKLRSGVKFHDGSDFDAEAVKFNIERWWNPKHPNGYRNAGKNYEIWQYLFGGFKGEPNSLLQEISVSNKYTIRFVLKQPFAAFPAAIGSGYFGISSPTAIKKAGANYGNANSLAVGTGPFIFKNWRTGDRILLEKNPNYWKKDDRQQGFPKVDRLVIRFIADPAARLAQLRAKQIDFTIDLAPDQIKEVQSDPNLKAMPRPSFNVGYLALNPSYKPLADVRVRQAINHAINKKALVQAFWGNLGQPSNHFIPPSLAKFKSAKVTESEYNPQKAKQLLTAAGYPNGFNLELWYMPVSRPYFPTPKPIAEAFAADLSAVGIRVNLKTKDWAAYLADRQKPPGFQAFMMGWTGDYGDPDNFYYPHFGPGSTTDLGGWKNDRLLQLLERGRATGDAVARTKIYSEVDEILSRELVRLPIVHSQPLLAQRKNINGWVPSPLGTESFEAIVK